MNTFARLLLVAFALTAGCATEDIDSPEAENAAAAAPAPAPDEPVAADESALHSRFFVCGGQQCDSFRNFCCNNRCVRFSPGTFCLPQNNEGSNE